MGKAEVVYAEKVIGTVDLVAGDDVKESGLLIFVEKAKSIFNSVYMKVLVVLAIVAVLVFIILCIKLNIDKLKKRKVRYIPYKERNRHEK